MLLNLVVKNLINLQRLMAAHKFRVNKTSTARGVAQAGGEGKGRLEVHKLAVIRSRRQR